MALTKYKLGDLIEQRREKYDNVSDLPIRGVSKDGFIDARQPGADLSMYHVFYKGDFVLNPARMEINSIAFNSYFDKAICSSLYEIFYIKREDILIPEFLNIFVKREEFARLCAYIGWGSAREYCRISNLNHIDITLPSIEVQQKFVDIYLALQKNLEIYQSKTEDLKLVCDGYIEDLRRKFVIKEVGQYIRSVDNRNTDLSITLTQGVDVNLQFIPAKREAEDQEGSKIVRTGQFAFNKVVKSNGTKLPIALREGPDCVISSSYEVFEITNREKILPEYLMLWMSRPETHRYCGYISQGTTRDIFSFNDLCKLKLPIPSIEIQKDIVKIYKCYIERLRIAEKLKEKLKDICPVLIKGSLQSEIS